MSKKKHKYGYQQHATENAVIAEETSIEYEDVSDEEDDDIITDSEIITEEIDDVEEISTIESIEEIHLNDNINIEKIDDTTKVEEVIIPEVVKEKPINHEVKSIIKFYNVGTDYINNKCINQITFTPNLEIAKAECIKARDAQHKTYHVFDKEGNVIYTAEYNIPRDNYYRVGTEWKNGRCINQKYYTVNLDEACRVSNEYTKNTGIVHNVYHPSGMIVFMSKKKLTLLSYKKRKVNKNADWYTK